MMQARAGSRAQRGRRRIRLSPGGEIRLEPPEDRRGAALRAAGAAAVMFLVTVSAWLYGQPPDNPALASAIRSEQREAFFASRAFAAAGLPGSCRIRFAPFSADSVEWLGGGRYAVFSFAEAIPGPGETRGQRVYFTCVLARTPEGGFCLESLTLEEAVPPAGRADRDRCAPSR